MDELKQLIDTETNVLMVFRDEDFNVTVELHFAPDIRQVLKTKTDGTEFVFAEQPEMCGVVLSLNIDTEWIKVSAVR